MEGDLFASDDNNAKLLTRWVQEGAKYLEHRKLNHEITPERFVAASSGDRTRLQVVAHYDDGLTRDVTAMTQFVVEDSDAVKIDSDDATALFSSYWHVITRYSTEVVPIEFIVPVSASEMDFSAIASNFVDQEVLGSPSYVFPSLLLPMMRRSSVGSLGLTGRLPPFRDGTQSGHLDREKLVDQLLASEEFVEFYALKLVGC